MPQEKFGNHAQAETLHSEKRRISRSNFQGEKSGHSIILPCRLRYDVESGKFFWYREIDNFENYQACFVFSLANLLKTNGNK